MAKLKSSLQARIAALEDELKQRDVRIRKLRADLDKAEQFVNEMREHVEDASALTASWIEAFDMVATHDCKWSWKPFIERHNDLVGRHNELVREWNKFMPAAAVRPRNVGCPRNVGRPLAASEAQVAQVRKLHKQGTSLRSIAEETSLGVRTVRTIVERVPGKMR